MFAIFAGVSVGGLDRNNPEASIFRRVRVNGATESITVCGRCYQERKP